MGEDVTGLVEIVEEAEEWWKRSCNAAGKEMLLRGRTPSNPAPQRAEVQDDGSLLLTVVLGPGPHETVRGRIPLMSWRWHGPTQ